MKKILICDDHPSMVEATKSILGSLGYKAGAVMSCVNIIEDVQRIQPDLVLMDIRMPKVNGDTATRILKENPATAHIPIIIFSADVQYEPKAKEAGADDFLGKPFEINDLQKKIDKLLKGSGKEIAK